MFPILCRRGSTARRSLSIFAAQQFRSAFLVRSCTSSVCENVSQEKEPFSVSYLIKSCGLSSKDAISASKKLRFTTPEKPDAVLELLRKYQFTNADISKLVTKCPLVLLARPTKTLMPKLDFFLSIGVPLNVLVKNVSRLPSVLMPGLENTLIPTYRLLKTLLGSDERVVSVFRHKPRVFGYGRPGGISAIISTLRERGLPESSIVSLVIYQPSILIISKEMLDVYFDRAVEMGFNILKVGFGSAVGVLFNLSEATMKRKMDVYTRCGWSETDIKVAFLRQPFCMKISEKKIMTNMEFLVKKLGCTPAWIAHHPVLLAYNLDKRIKPRCLVAGILKEKGLWKMANADTLLNMSEEKFLKNCIVKYEKDVPELLDIYRGKLSPGSLLK